MFWGSIVIPDSQGIMEPKIGTEGILTNLGWWDDETLVEKEAGLDRARSSHRFATPRGIVATFIMIKI